MSDHNLAEALPHFDDMTALQRRLHNAAIVLGADGDEYGFEGLLREAIVALAAPSAQAVPQQADTVTLVGVKADGTEHVLGTATMPPKMRAKELVREMFGSIDEETGDDGAMALWVCEQLIEWMQETSLVVTLTNQAEQGGK